HLPVLGQRLDGGHRQVEPGGEVDAQDVVELLGGLRERVGRSRTTGVVDEDVHRTVDAGCGGDEALAVGGDRDVAFDRHDGWQVRGQRGETVRSAGRGDDGRPGRGEGPGEPVTQTRGRAGDHGDAAGQVEQLCR